MLFPYTTVAPSCLQDRVRLNHDASRKTRVRGTVYSHISPHSASLVYSRKLQINKICRLLQLPIVVLFFLWSVGGGNDRAKELFSPSFRLNPANEHGAWPELQFSSNQLA